MITVPCVFGPSLQSASNWKVVEPWILSSECRCCDLVAPSACHAVPPRARTRRLAAVLGVLASVPAGTRSSLETRGIRQRTVGMIPLSYLVGMMLFFVAKAPASQHGLFTVIITLRGGGRRWQHHTSAMRSTISSMCVIGATNWRSDVGISTTVASSSTRYRGARRLAFSSTRTRALKGGPSQSCLSERGDRRTLGAPRRYRWLMMRCRAFPIRPVGRLYAGADLTPDFNNRSIRGYSCRRPSVVESCDGTSGFAIVTFSSWIRSEFEILPASLSIRLSVFGSHTEPCAVGPGRPT